MAPSRILAEIQQTKPFPTLEEEASVAFVKTADHLHRAMAHVLDPSGLTEQQYNVLRILRGAGAAGLPTLSIADRLVQQTPGITRLIDRLEAKGLVRRERPAADRRQVSCFVTPAGLDALAPMDPLVSRAAKHSFRLLSKPEIRALLNTLEKIRDGNAPRES